MGTTNTLISEFTAIMGGGKLAPTDDPKNAGYALTLLADKCSCAGYWNTLNLLDGFIATHHIPYQKGSMNSNSVISTAIDAMGLKRPKLPFSGLRVPGWGHTLPGWPPRGLKNNPKGANDGCCN